MLLLLPVLLVALFIYVLVGIAAALGQLLLLLLLSLFLLVVRPAAGRLLRWWRQRRRWKQLDQRYRSGDPPRKHSSWGSESFELERPLVDRNGIPYLSLLPFFFLALMVGHG